MPHNIVLSIASRTGLIVASGDEDDPPFWHRFLAETGANFEAEALGPPSIETLRQLYTSVLANYEHRCALSGASFPPPADFLHDDLQVAAIRPLHSGGKMHVSNFLCLQNDMAEVFRLGHITIGRDFEIIVDVSRTGGDLVKRLNPMGRLHLPKTDIAMPDSDSVMFHRRTIFVAA